MTAADSTSTAAVTRDPLADAKRRPPRRRASEPVCGACGYPVRGLPNFACPECGGDLREVGITGPRLAGAGGLGWKVLRAASVSVRVVVAASLLVGPAVGLSAVLGHFLAWHKEVEVATVTTKDRVAESVLTTTGEGYLTPTRKDRLTIEFVYAVPHARIDVDLNYLYGTYTDVSGRTVQGTVDHKFFTNLPVVYDDEASDVMAAILRVRNGGSLPGGAVSDYRIVPAWVPALAAAIWLPGWYLLARLIFTRPARAAARRRADGPPAAAPPPTAPPA